MSKYKYVMLNKMDHVAVALEDLPAGAEIHIQLNDELIVVSLTENIEFGHKFAVRAIDKGCEILKYGEVIGKAVVNISIGSHVHVHNLEGIRGRGDRIDTGK